jgi:uncharacterized membrane protein YagU involved in acid resistance
MWENGHRCRNRHKSLFEITVVIAGGTAMPQLSTGISSFVSALPRAIVGGLAGTIVFTLMMKFLAPAMIGHPMDIAAVLGRFTGLGTPTGAVMHFVLGTFGFAIGFVIVGPYLPGPGWLRGVIFMAAVWFLAGLIAMPLLGVGLFFGGAKEAMAALIGHVVFGAILGTVAPLPDRLIQLRPS